MRMHAILFRTFAHHVRCPKLDRPRSSAAAAVGKLIEERVAHTQICVLNAASAAGAALTPMPRFRPRHPSIFAPSKAHERPHLAKLQHARPC